MTLPPGWPYEAITAVILAAVPLYVLELWLKRKKRVTGIGRQLLAAVGVVLWCVLLYGSFIAPRFLTVKEYPVPLGEGASNLKIAVITDTHLGVYKHRDWLAKVVARTNALQPDVVLLTGDFVTVPAGRWSLEPLRGLKAPQGAWAVLGNYDYRVGAVETRKLIESYGIEVLTNEGVELAAGGDGRPPLWLLGLDDQTYGHPDWDAALANVPPDAVKIVAAHNPDAAPQAEVNGIDLLITGHTHGGQIRLPGIGPIANLPTHIGRKFDRGLFEYGKLKLFISQGVGESGPRARLFCPPEISVLDVAY